MNNLVEFGDSMKIFNDGEILPLTVLNCGYNFSILVICIMTENNKQYNLCYLAK